MICFGPHWATHHWWAENLRIFTQSWFQFYKWCDKSSWSVESDILTSNRWTPNLSVNKRSVLPTSMCALSRSVLALYFKTSPQLLTVVIGQVCIILVRALARYGQCIMTMRCRGGQCPLFLWCNVSLVWAMRFLTMFSWKRHVQSFFYNVLGKVKHRANGAN